jgi:hypothetical protein
MNVNTDELVEILKNDKPLNVTMVEEFGKDKLIVLFALPHLSTRIIEFAESILAEGDIAP